MSLLAKAQQYEKKFQESKAKYKAQVGGDLTFILGRTRAGPTAFQGARGARTHELQHDPCKYVSLPLRGV